MLPFLIDEMGGWAGGRRRQDGRVAAASGRFLLEIENRQKSATVGLGGFFFVFYEVGWLVVLPYLRYLCRNRSCKVGKVR